MYFQFSNSNEKKMRLLNMGLLYLSLFYWRIKSSRDNLKMCAKLYTTVEYTTTVMPESGGPGGSLGRSVNPIPSKMEGDKLCPPYYHLPPRFSNLPTALYNKTIYHLSSHMHQLFSPLMILLEGVAPFRSLTL